MGYKVYGTFTFVLEKQLLHLLFLYIVICQLKNPSTWMLTIFTIFRFQFKYSFMINCYTNMEQLKITFCNCYTLYPFHFLFSISFVMNYFVIVYMLQMKCYYIMKFYTIILNFFACYKCNAIHYNESYCINIWFLLLQIQLNWQYTPHKLKGSWQYIFTIINSITTVPNTKGLSAFTNLSPSCGVG